MKRRALISIISIEEEIHRVKVRIKKRKYNLQIATEAMSEIFALEPGFESIFWIHRANRFWQLCQIYGHDYATIATTCCHFLEESSTLKLYGAKGRNRANTSAKCFT